MKKPWSEVEAESAVDDVMDGWSFDGPWTDSEVRQFRDEMVRTFLTDATKVARCIEQEDRRRTNPDSKNEGEA